MSDTEKYWIAGIFEGEGYCGRKGLTKAREPYGAELKIVMTDEDIIRRCHEITQIGVVRALDSPSRLPHYRLQWMWRVANRRGAATFLAQIYPILGERRQAQARPLL